MGARADYEDSAKSCLTDPAGDGSVASAAVHTTATIWSSSRRSDCRGAVHVHRDPAEPRQDELVALTAASVSIINATANVLRNSAALVQC